MSSEEAKRYYKYTLENINYAEQLGISRHELIRINQEAMEMYKSSKKIEKMTEEFQEDRKR